MKQRAGIAGIIMAIVDVMPNDLGNETLDKWLDYVEEKIEQTSNKVDDAVLLPLLTAARRSIGLTEEEGSPYADGTT